MQCLECHTQKKSQSCHFWQSTEEELRKNHRPTFVKNVKSLNRYYRENQSLCSSSNCFECGPLWLHWLVGGAASNFLSNVKFAIQELGWRKPIESKNKQEDELGSQLNEIRVKIQRSLRYIAASKIPQARIGENEKDDKCAQCFSLLGEKSLFSGYVIRRQMLGGSWNQCPFKLESWVLLIFDVTKVLEILSKIAGEDDTCKPKVGSGSKTNLNFFRANIFDIFRKIWYHFKNRGLRKSVVK